MYGGGTASGSTGDTEVVGAGGYRPRSGGRKGGGEGNVGGYGGQCRHGGGGVDGRGGTGDKTGN